MEGVRVALCAVESDPQPGDVYLDDADHHALSIKFGDDFAYEDLMEPPVVGAAERNAIDSQVVRSAQAEFERWNAQEQRPLKKETS